MSEVVYSEHCLIGCIILDPEIFEDVVSCISGAWLTDKKNKDIWALFEKCRKSGVKWDLPWLADHKADYEHMLKCMDSVTSSSEFPRYLETIRLKRLNQAIFLQLDKDPDNIHAVETILEKYNNTLYGGKTRSTNEIFDVALKQALDPEREPEIKLPWNRLNNYLFGLKRGGFYIVAGRPGHNKTNFLYNMVVSAAMQKKHWLLCDYEMSPEDIVFRLTSIYTGIPLSYLTKGRDESGARLKEAQLYQVKAAIDKTKEELGEYVHIRKDIRMSEIKKEVRAVKADIVSIDHIQIFAQVMPKDRTESTSYHLSNLCREIKTMASELNIACVVPSQVSRGIEGELPRLNDLKESGGLEENADVVITILTPSVVHQDREDYKGLFQIFTPKNRNGPQGRMDMNLDTTTGKITEQEYRYEHPPL